MTVIDYAWFAPTIAQLDAAGVTGVIRYVGPPGWGKTIQQAEFDALVAAGIAVTLVFEIGSNDGAGGFAGGVANAHTALLYVPAGYTGGIYFAIDTAVSGADLDTAVAYIAGASSVVGPAKTGDYAEGALCKLTEAAGTAKYHWQSESTSFPDNDVLQPMTHLWQKVDGSPFPGNADFDLVIKADYGQHPSPNPSPTPTPTEDPMLGLSPMVKTSDGAWHRASIVYPGGLCHSWTYDAKTWLQENVAKESDPSGGPISALTFDANQVPTCQVIDNPPLPDGTPAPTSLVIGAQQASGGKAFDFIQTTGTPGWGAREVV